MKTKISVSIDDETVQKIESELKTGFFRNKSHVIEYAIKQFLGGKQNE